MRRRGVLVTRSGRRSKDGCSSRRSPSGERRGRRPPAAARSGLAGRRWPSPRRIGQGQEVGEDAEARGSGRRHPDVERLHRADRRRRRGARPAAGRRRPARGRPPPSGCRCRANDGRVLPGRFGANSASQSVSRSRPHRYRSARVPPIIESRLRGWGRWECAPRRRVSRVRVRSEPHRLRTVKHQMASVRTKVVIRGGDAWRCDDSGEVESSGE
jgi:hypothetical protein